MLSIYDKFTINVLRQSIRYFKWVTNVKVDESLLIFTLEKPTEELRITKDVEGNYLFLYTTNDKSRSECFTEDTLTLKNLQLKLGYLFNL